MAEVITIQGSPPLSKSTLARKIRLVLDTPQGARNTLGRLARMRFRGEVDSQVVKDIVYIISTMLGYDRLIADMRIDSRLDKLEAKIAEAENEARDPDQ